MKCPFCGEEMREGALQTKAVREDLSGGWRYRWVPPVPAEEPEAPRAQGKGITLEAVLETAREKLDELQKNRVWDLDSAVCVEPRGEDRGWKELLFTGDCFLGDAWYCPKCEKALCVFSRDEGRDEWLDQPKRAEKDEKPAPPERRPETPAPPPPRRPKPRDDPWEKKGLFGRRKKPDWEK